MSQIYNALRKRDAEVVSDGLQDEIITDQSRIFHLPSPFFDESPEFLEEIAGLSTNLSILAKGNLNTLMLFGVKPNAGTTLVAMNLAFYMVRKERVPTLFVEANFQRPTLFRYQNGYAADGFFEFLAEQGPLNKYVLPSSTPNLFVLNAGRVTGESTEFFTSSRIEHVVAECKSNYPLVIFDAAPLWDGNGSLELAKFVDSVIMVVRANSFADEAQRAKATLENLQANMTGVVFNHF